MTEGVGPPSPASQVSAHQALVPEGGREGETSVLGLLNALLKRWRIVAGFPLVTTVVVVGVSFLLSPTFTATTTFVPETRTQYRVPAGVAGAAGQLGISLGGDANQSPRFYAQVVKSRELFERALLSRYADPQQSAITDDSVTLLQILRVSGRDEADSLARGVKKLDGLVSVSVDYQTNIVRLSIDSRYPGLAAAVANRLVGYLNDFNTRTRQSQARERRKFVEQRIADGEHELRSAEEDLRRFYERNRSWQQSPQLVFEEGRLRRQVQIQQEVYLTLKREYETARIEEVNDTPVLTVVDVAVPPQERSKPKRRLFIFVALLVSGMVSVCWALWADYLESAHLEPDSRYAEFRETVQRVRREVGHLFRPGRSRHRPGSS